MPTIEAITLLNRVSTELNDSPPVTWPLAKLLDYLNVAQRDAATLNDKVNPVKDKVLLVQGISQTAPAGTIKIIDLLYNLGTSGTTPGKAINRVARQVINKRNPSWPTDTASAVVKNYILDDDFSVAFDVYPAQPASPGYVQMEFTKIPATIPNTNAGTTITIDDQWEQALFHKVCSMALGNESDLPNSQELSAKHYQLYLQALQLSGNDQVATKEQK